MSIQAHGDQDSGADSTLVNYWANELCERWAQGDRVRVEDLVPDFPSLSAESALELVYQEFVLSQRESLSPTLDTYASRFPNLAERLQSQLAVDAGFANAFSGQSLPELCDPAIESKHTDLAETNASLPLKAIAGSVSTVVGVGSQLGPYQVLAKLGEGGMGAVYKARHTKLGRLVALKVLPPHVLVRPDALSRFEREMKAVGTLSHPNVVQAFDAGEINGVHYLSMEYVEGNDLQAVVKTNGPLSVVNACNAIRQAALGLAAAHKLGLVHRDIKPSNLFLTKDTEQIKILDMGLALLSEEENADALTSTGHCFGTPDYIAPEQWENAHSCDGRTDLYALGCTMFLLLIGRTPYSGDQYRTVPRKMRGHIHDPIPDLMRLRPEVPLELDIIYRKLMAKDPNDRFASADQLVQILTPFTCASSLFNSPKEPKASPECSNSGNAESHTNKRESSGPAAAHSPAEGTPRGGSHRNSLLVVAGGVAALVLLSVFVITINDTYKAAITNHQGNTKSDVTAQGIKSLQTVMTQTSTPDIGSLQSSILRSDAIDFAVERKVAEWVLSTNGVITIKMKNVGNSFTITDLAQLPKEPFHVFHIYLKLRHAVKKSDFELISQLKELNTLHTPETQVDDSYLVDIGKLTQLENLNLLGTQVTDAGLSELVSLQKLKTLDLMFTKVGDDGMAYVSELTSLNDLKLGESRVGDDGLVRLKKLSQLQHLGIGSRVTAQGLSHLAGLNEITAVSVLKSNHLTDVGIGHLRKLPNLRAMNVVNATDSDLERLTALNDLSALGFNYNQFTPSGFEKIQAFSKLEEIHVSENGNLNDAILTPLSKLPKLRKVTLTRLNLTAEGIAKFRGLRPYVELSALGNVYPASDPIDFAAERKSAEDLIGLKFHFQIETDGSLLRPTELAQLPNGPFYVYWLDLVAQPAFKKSDLELVVRLKKLKGLNLQETRVVNDSYMTYIGKLTELEYLNLLGTGVTDAGLAELVGLKKLRILSLHAANVGDEGMAHVAKLTGLNELRLGETRVGDAGLAAIKKLSQLQHLGIGGRVTAQGLEHLAELGEISGVSNLKSNHLTEVGIGHLRKLPKLGRLNVVNATDADLERLESLNYLSELNFNYNQFTVEGFEKIQAFSKLEDLYVSENANLNDAILMPLSQLPKLQRLFLRNLNLTVEGVEAFRNTRPDVQLELNGKTL